MLNLKTFLILLSLSTLSICGQSCLPGKVADKKQFYHLGRQREVVISTRTGHRESRLIAKVFGIVADEVLGYRTKLLLMNDEELSFDTASQFSRLSTCQDPLCHKMVPKPSPTIPPAMITLDMWLPPSQDVDSWGLLDVGQLGPAVRFGLLTTNNEKSSTVSHWKMLKSRESVKNLSPTREQLKDVKEHTRDGNKGYYCSETYCTAGMFISPACKDDYLACGLLIASYPGSSAIHNTSLLVQFITANALLLNIAFVGPNLPTMVNHMDQSTKQTENSFVVLHHYPSILASQYNLQPMLVPQCQDPLLQRDRSNPACFFNVNRLAKVAWRPVQKEAPKLYNFLQHFSFLPEEYEELLKLHSMMTDRSSPISDIETEVACAWLKKQESNVTGEKQRSWLERQRNLMKLQQKPKLYIGGIFPLSGTKYKAPVLAEVALMAVKDVNSNPHILPNYNLDLSVFDGQCEADVVMKRFIDIIKTKDASRFQSTVGMLGPACSDTVAPIAGVSKHFRTVVISYSAEGSISKENMKDYPYFFRTISENKQYKYAYMRTLEQLGWGKVAAMTQEGQKYSDYISALQDKLQNSGIEFVMNRKFPADATNMQMYLKSMRERGARVIIGDFFENSARHIMCDAYKMGMTQREGYVWFLPGWFGDKWYDIDMLKKYKKGRKMKSLLDSEFRKSINMYEISEVGTLPNCTTKEMLSALNGHLSLMHANLAQDDRIIPDGRTVGKWKQDFQEHLNGIYFKYMAKNSQQIGKIPYKNDVDAGIKPDRNSGYVYDAVLLYAKALHRLVEQSNQSYIQNMHSERTVNAFVKIIRETDFHGVSGRINFKGRPSRLSNIRIMQCLLDKSQLRKYEVGVYEPNYDLESMDIETDDDLIGKMITWNEQNLNWQTKDGMKPLDNPIECGVLSSFATNLDIKCQLAITFSFLIALGIALFILMIIFLFQKRRYDLKMAATEERMRSLGLLTPMNVLTLDEWEISRDRVVMNRKLGEGAFGQVCGGEFFIDDKGWVAVAVKTLKTGSSVDEKVDFLSEAEMMKRFEHRNIVKLLGVCTRTEPIYTVMEFMLYGDLKTFLLARRHLASGNSREDVDEVSNKRLTAMAADVAAGLSYLADQKYVHRDVAARNCLVNDSRTVKLADFGMTRSMYESDYYRFSKKGMLPVRWMSSESLADGLFTPMSDIWSYGVLLYEIITFGSFPFQGLSNTQVMQLIKSGDTLTIPHGISQTLSELLTSCWSKNPSKRPSTSEILELFSCCPRLICPSIDAPMASVNLELDISSEAGTKPKIATDFLNLKLQLSSDYRVPEEEGYSPMATLQMPPLHDGIVQPGYNSLEGTEDERNTDLVSGFVESGYMTCNAGQSREDTVQ